MAQLTSVQHQTHTFGELSLESNNGTTTIGGAGTWTEISSSWTQGQSNSMTLASDSITVVTSGNYQAGWNISSLSATANKNFEVAFSVNDTIQNDTLIERRYSSTDVGASSGGGVLNLSAGDVIKLEVKGLTDATNFQVKHGNVQVHKL